MKVFRVTKDTKGRLLTKHSDGTITTQNWTVRKDLEFGETSVLGHTHPLIDHYVKKGWFVFDSNTKYVLAVPHDEITIVEK